MRVLILDDNLFWSARWVRSLRALGHDTVVVATAEQASALLTEVGPTTQVAIVNLGSQRLPIVECLALLGAHGVLTLGHAGHKEKGLLDRGREAGCDLVVTNSELTYKLPDVLARLMTLAP